MIHLSPRQRFLLLLASLPVLLVVFASLYVAGMHHLEGKERDFWSALEWAAETMTTTGYGADARWHHPLMILFVIGLQFFGVILVYMLVPLVLIPFFEERFEARLPRRVPKLEDHIIIFRFGPAVETVLIELVEADKTVVLIECDESIARNLQEHWARRQWLRGPTHRRTLHLLFDEDPATALERAHFLKAKTLILNDSDEANALALLAARQSGFEGDVLSMVDEPYHRRPLAQAGATAVITPRHVLGAALAARASHRIEPRVGGIQQLGQRLRVAEIRIDPASFLADKTLRQADVRQRTGATVVGQWLEGDLDPHPHADLRLEPRGILVAVGSRDQLESLSQLATDGQSLRSDGPFIVAGYGEVGRKVVELLSSVGEKVLVVDRQDLEGVDICGDISRPSVIKQLDLARARALILALDSDQATLFAALVIKSDAADLPTIARVNMAENVERIHLAGADFALSISQVSAQILGQRLLQRNQRALGTGLQILKSESSSLVDNHPSATEIRERTGCSVVAVERNDEVITQIGPGFAFEEQDAVYICGHRTAIEHFLERYGAAQN